MLQNAVKSKLDSNAEPRQCCQKQLEELARSNADIDAYVNELKFMTIGEQDRESRNQAVARGASLEAGASPLKLHRVDLKIPNHQRQSNGLAIIQQESVESGFSALGGGRSPANRH